MTEDYMRLAAVAEKMADALNTIVDDWLDSSGDGSDGQWIVDILNEYDDITLDRIKQRLDDYDTERRGNQYAAD